MAESPKVSAGVRARRLVTCGLLVAVVVLVVGLVVIGLSATVLRPTTASVVLQSDVTPSPEVSSGQMLKSLRATEDATLTSYGWIDRSKGVVGIPIDKAIDLLAQRGLPTQPPSQKPIQTF